MQKLSKWLAPGILALAGMFSLVMVVWADNATTSVVISNATPTVSVAASGGFNLTSSTLTLNEGTYKWATSTVTITDGNGCQTINHVTASFRIGSTTGEASPFLGGAASKYCVDNDDDRCYKVGSTTVGQLLTGCFATTTGNQCLSSTDTSVDYDCAFKVWYIAEPSDAAPWASSIWLLSATTSDGVATTTATNTPQAIEVSTLYALDVTSSLSYGTLAANTNTGATNSTTTATSTGNAAIDADISQTTALTSGAFTIPAANQEYSNVAFTYTAGTDLTTSPVNLELGNANPTSTTSPPSSDISWGLNVPAGQANGTYSGVNLFSATTD